MSETDVSKINSHIQIPKQILKHFQDDKDRLYYYDVETQRIKKGRAKTFNTEVDYYSPKVEEYLNKYFEDKIGKLIHHIENEWSINSNCKIPSDFKEVIFRYIASLFSRSKTTVKDIIDYYPNLQSLDKQVIHDKVAVYCIEAIMEDGYLESYVPSVLYNKSQEDFVLPLCGVYSYKTTGKCAIAPIRPNIAFALIDKTIFESKIDEEHFTVLIVQKEMEIRQFNKLALSTQIKQKEGSVISRSKALLEDLIKQ